MAERIQCPSCKAITYNGAQCHNCGAPLIRDDTTQDLKRWDAESDFNKEVEGKFESYYGAQAQNCAYSLYKLKLGEFMRFERLHGARFAGLRKLGVPKNWKALVYSTNGALEREFGPGLYNISKERASDDVFAGFIESYKRNSVNIFRVPSVQIPVTFMLPGCKLLANGEFQCENLSSSSIRSAEGYMGGASVEMIVHVEDAPSLLRTVVDLKDEPDKGANIVLAALSAPFNILGSLISPGGGKKSKDFAHEPVNGWVLWEKVRNEFIQAIQAVVLTEAVREMYSAVEVRERIHQKIQDTMAVTMRRYGLVIDRVVSFRFMCPQYDMILQNEANVAQEEAEMETEERRAELRSRAREIAERDAADAAAADEKIRKAQIEAEKEVLVSEERAGGEKDKARDERLAAEQERERAMDAARQDHDRAQDALGQDHRRVQLEANERLDISLKKEKWLAALEIREKALDGENRRQIQLLQTIAEAGLPADSILALQLREHPELAGAYSDAVRARSYEERIQMQKEFENKLLTIGMSDKKYVHEFLKEGINQIGRVMTANQNRNRAQIVAAGGMVHSLGQAQGDDADTGGL